MKYLAIIAVVLLSLIVGFGPNPASAVCPNLVVNPDMEGSAGWTSTGGYATDAAHGGTRSWKITGTGSSIYGYQNIALEAGTEYIVEGWVKTDSAVSPNGARLRIVMTGISNQQTSYVTSTTDWTYKTVTFTTAAAGTARLDLNMVTTGTAWFDDISLAKTSCPAPTDTPTNTPIPPTDTPTNTPTNTPTDTPVPPTDTPTNTPTDTPTNTPTNTATPTPIPCTNYVLNPGMELSTNWSGDGSYATDFAHSGTQSRKITAVSSNYSYQSITLSPSTAYTLRGWIKTSGIGTGSGDTVELRYNVTAATAANYKTVALKGTNDWTYKEVQFTTAANYSAGRLDLKVVSTTGTAWFDDVEIVLTSCVSGTPTPTNTPAPPTNTPTNTPVPPTSTPTATPVPGQWTDLGGVPGISTLPDTTCGEQSTNPDWIHTISHLTWFNGDLFLSYGDYGCNVPVGTHLRSWDIASGTAVDWGALNSDSLLDMVVTDEGLLYVGFTDTSSGSFPCYATVDTAGTVVSYNNSIRCVHMFTAVWFNGKPYVGGAGQWAIATCANAQSIWRKDAGNVWVVWTDFDGSPGDDPRPNSYVGACDDHATRVHGLFVYNNKIYAGTRNPNSLLSSTSGDFGSWSSTGLSQGTSRMKLPMHAGGFVYWGSQDPGFTTGGLWRFNGTSVTTVVSSGVWDHTVGSDGNLYYLNSAGQIKNEAGTTVETAPAEARSIAYINGVWYVGDSQGHLWKK